MTTQSMTGSTISMTMGAAITNPIRDVVVAARRAQADLTPRQRAVRDQARAQVEALRASGHFSLARRF